MPEKSGTKASKEVDRQLDRYRSMRDFSVTAEPSGKSSTGTKSTLPFVIQKHAATRLHYDFRLGWNGVLKSWAVAKGPSYFPGDKRLAVEVEDHPIEYGGFEGTIPKGQYGGGTVMVWDHGTWLPHGDADEGFRTGRLKFELHGAKLKGNWTLVRMGGKFAKESKPNWLLIKEHDEYERGPNDPPITEEAPDSAITGRDLDAIAKAEDHVWQSHVPESHGPNRSRLTLRRKAQSNSAAQSENKSKSKPAPLVAKSSAALTHAPHESIPHFLKPELASEAKSPPAGDDWLHELKLDGYRIQAHINGGKVTLYSRNGLDWTHRMPAIAHALQATPAKSAILDGEVVVLDEQGNASFAKLQAAFDVGSKAQMTYVLFDLPHLDGHNLRELPLDERKQILQSLITQLNDSGIRFSEHIRGNGVEMFSSACELGAEGIVSKKAGSKYCAGRSKEWLKSKCILQQEFVIGGYTLPSDRGSGIGALLLGYHQDGKLIYAGRTGTGFTQQSRAHLRKQLEKMRATKCAFAEVPRQEQRDAIWVKPELVGEVNFTTWTEGGMVRQASFQGLREDKSAKEVVREQAGAIAKPERKSPSAKSAPKSAPPKPSKDEAEVDGVRRGPREQVLVHGVKITHPDKVLDEETHLTKQQLAEYYSAVADVMLPHVADRPLSIVRCPEGSGKPCFFQKHIGPGLPAGIGSVPVKSKSGDKIEQYLTISKAEGLIGFAQMGGLEIHPWGSRNESMETPDRLIFDLDPDESLEWKRLVASAIEVHDLLSQLGLESFVKSTGGKGIHVVAPIRPERSWAEVKDFAHRFARMMESANPKLYLTKMTKAARKGRIYLDYLRNEREATAVAPYSPRARKGARVAIPFTWDELKKMTARPEFAVANFAEWKSRLKHDPWAKMESIHQSLTTQALRAVNDFAA